MLSITFKSNDNSPSINKQQNRRNLSPNAQYVLHKTNKYSCGANLADSLTAPNKDVGNIVKDIAMYQAMSSPLINTIYTGTQVKKHNVSKEEANKIFLYNMLCH